MTLREQMVVDNTTVFDPNKAKWDRHVFDSEGILLTKFIIDRSFSLFRIYGDRLFLMDTQNEMAVYEYKIVEK